MGQQRVFQRIVCWVVEGRASLQPEVSKASNYVRVVTLNFSPLQHTYLCDLK